MRHCSIKHVNRIKASVARQILGHHPMLYVYIARNTLIYIYVNMYYHRCTYMCILRCTQKIVHCTKSTRTCTARYLQAQTPTRPVKPPLKPYNSALNENNGASSLELEGEVYELTGYGIIRLFWGVLDWMACIWWIRFLYMARCGFGRLMFWHLGFRFSWLQGVALLLSAQDGLV